jgi:hypothetical protein
MAVLIRDKKVANKMKRAAHPARVQGAWRDVQVPNNQHSSSGLQGCYNTRLQGLLIMVG